jgi:protein SCO1/2
MRVRDRQHPVIRLTEPRRIRRALMVLLCGLALRAACADSALSASTAAVSTHSSNGIRRTLEHHPVPSLAMVREDGTHTMLDRELDDGRPVVVNFIYTSCTTICPLSSQEFSRLQQMLGADSARVHLVSISVDPEEDTPSRLRAYARHFHAGAEWDYYTGTLQASLQAQTAFNVYRGDKLTHAPVTFLRASPTSEWVRLDGFATADDLYSELRNMHLVR